MDNETAAYLERLGEAARGTFWDYIGAQMEVCSRDRVVVYVDIEPHHLNLIGIVHGGVHATLIDSAMGLVVMAAKPNDRVVTTNLNIHYLAPVEKGRFKVTAQIVHSSRKLVTTQGQACNEQGELCAFGTGTFRVMDLGLK